MKERRVTVSTAFWTDPDLETWGPLSKYFYLYLYGNEHVHGLTGVGRVSLKRMRSETNLTTAQVARAKAEIGDRVLWFQGDCYLVAARSRHTCYTAARTPSPNHVAGAWNALKDCASEIVAAWCERYGDLADFARGLEAPPDPQEKPPGNPSQGPMEGRSPRSIGIGSKADSESRDKGKQQRHKQGQGHVAPGATHAEALLLAAAARIRLNGPALARLLEVARSDAPEAGPAYALAIIHYAASRGRNAAALAASILGGDRKIGIGSYYEDAKRDLRTWEERCQKETQP